MKASNFPALNIIFPHPSARPINYQQAFLLKGGSSKGTEKKSIRCFKSKSSWPRLVWNVAAEPGINLIESRLKIPGVRYTIPGLQEAWGGRARRGERQLKAVQLWLGEAKRQKRFSSWREREQNLMQRWPWWSDQTLATGHLVKCQSPESWPHPPRRSELKN